jgi:hypothetical protein
MADLTEQELNQVAAEVRRQLDEYLLSAVFEGRAHAACAEIQAGGLRTTAELADALGLPEPFLAFALEKQAAKFVADHGGLQ